MTYYRYLVEPDDTRHTCALPSYNGEGTHRGYLAPNTVVRCDCGKRYVWQYSSIDDNGYSDGWGWQRLSFWRPKHRTARRLLRARV